MSEATALVVRGVVEVGVATDDESERKGRTTAWSCLRRYYPGQLVTLPSAEVRRLSRLGILREL